MDGLEVCPFFDYLIVRGQDRYNCCEGINRKANFPIDSILSVQDGQAIDFNSMETERSPLVLHTWHVLS